VGLRSEKSQKHVLLYLVTLLEANGIKGYMFHTKGPNLQSLKWGDPIQVHICRFSSYPYAPEHPLNEMSVFLFVGLLRSSQVPPSSQTHPPV